MEDELNKSFEKLLFENEYSNGKNDLSKRTYILPVESDYSQFEEDCQKSFVTFEAMMYKKWINGCLMDHLVY